MAFNTVETWEDLQRLTIDETSITGSDGLPTAENSDPSLNRTDTNSTYAAKRWEEALKRCQKSLKGDFDAVSQFDSPEKLLAGLDELQRQHSSTTTALSGIMAQVLPTQQSFRELTVFFIGAMLPNSVTTGLIWGLLYLCIKLCADHAAASKQLADMLSKIRRQLALLNRLASKIVDQDEVCLAFVDIFEALIYFWSDCVSYFRDNPPTTPNVLQRWSKLEARFEETTTKIEDAMKHLERMLALGLGRQQSHLSRVNVEPGDLERATFPVVLLPNTRTSHFVGRNRTLTNMMAYFANPEIWRDQPLIYSICGIGGTGKTETALRYARLHLAKYDAVFWVRAETTESLRQGFTRIAVELGIPDAKLGGDPDHNLTLTHYWFRVSGKSWLLILDNVERFQTVQKYIPFECRGSIIVTTRYPEQARLFRRKVDVLSQLSNSESEVLFLRLMESPEGSETPTGTDSKTQKTLDDLSTEEREAALYLLSEMDGLVLGIQQIAALIRFQDLTGNVSKFAKKYRNMPQRIHQKNDGIDGHTLATLWKMTFDSIKSNANSWVVLGILSFLQADEVPKDIFLTNDETISKGRLSFCDEEDEVDEAIDALKFAGLVERKNEILSLHRLVQVAFLLQSDLSGEERQAFFDYACILIHQVFPKQVKGRPMYGQEQRSRKYIQHTQSLAALFKWLKHAKFAIAASTQFVDLMSNCAWYLFECGAQREALGLIEIALDACEDKKSLVYAHLLNSATMSYFKLNDQVNARRVLELSRSIREKLLDADDEELASTYGHLGNIEAADGNLDLAYRYNEQSLALRMNQSGAKVMIGVRNQCMGRILFLKGEFEAAAEKYRVCEQIFLEELGCDHFLMAGINFAWGNLEAAQGHYELARARFKRCLELLLQHYPRELKVPSTYFKIGCVELELGNFRESMDTLATGLQIARLRGADGRGDQARILRKQAEVLERAKPTHEILSLADMRDPEHLRGEAEVIRREIQKGILIGDLNDEERWYNSLVNLFDR